MKRKPKPANEPSLRDKLNASFVAALEADFAENGVDVIKRLREKSVERYADIVAKLIVATEPGPDGMKYNGSTTWEDIGRGLLGQIGCDEVEMTDELVQGALKLHDNFIEQLVALRASHGVLHGEIN